MVVAGKRRCLYCQRCEARKLAEWAFERLQLPATSERRIGLLFEVEAALPRSLQLLARPMVTAAVAGLLRHGDTAIAGAVIVICRTLVTSPSAARCVGGVLEATDAMLAEVPAIEIDGIEGLRQAAEIKRRLVSQS